MNRSIRHLPTLFVSSALALCLGLAACATSSGTPSAEASRSITVTANSEVKAVPDVARITVAITSQGEDAAAAQKANGTPTRAVIAALKELGVPDEEIQTSYTDLSPIWDESGATDTYEMRTVLEVSGLAVADVNTIMDACVAAGATEVNGPEYYVSSYDELYDQALAAAIEASRPKAETIAQASGAKLGKVVSVVEGYQDTSIAYAKTYDMAEEEAMDTGGTAPLEPGQVSVRAEVTVSYALN